MVSWDIVRASERRAGACRSQCSCLELKVLFDQGTPVPLRNFLKNHSVGTAHELGWATLKNGELLEAAEDSEYDVLVTTDKNLQYQQNLASRKISVIVLSATSWPRISKVTDRIVEAVENSVENSFVEVEIP